MSTPPKTLNWGIISTGLISSWFIRDLLLQRPNVSNPHKLTAIGSSSEAKGTAFITRHLPHVTPPPTLYTGYEAVYTDPNVDVVYIGTPHAFHKKNCLDAIKAGKHVLCEKAFTLNAGEAEEVFAAARAQGRVFIMEAMWTRFFPLVQQLQHMLHTDKVVGDVERVLVDFSLEQDIAGKDAEKSRLRNLDLGASTLLDIGIYSLTWGLFCCEQPIATGIEEKGKNKEEPLVKASSTLSPEGIDLATTIILHYPSTSRQAICTCSSSYKPLNNTQFCRIEGSKGHIIVDGGTAANPERFTVFLKKEGEKGAVDAGMTYEFGKPGGGRGFFWEADAVANCVWEGKRESRVMPWGETMRVMRILDEVRKQGGVRFGVDGV